MTESESGDDKGGSSDVPTTIIEENKGEDELNKTVVEQAPVLIRDEGVQIISSPPKDRAKALLLKPPSRVLQLLRALQGQHPNIMIHS